MLVAADAPFQTAVGHCQALLLSDTCHRLRFCVEDQPFKLGNLIVVSACPVDVASASEMALVYGLIVIGAKGQND